MAKYRKKPVVIDAMQVPRPGYDNAAEGNKFIAWLDSANSRYSIHPDAHVFLHTPEGVMEAYPGDFIIRGVKGELYPCKPGIFAMTYEPVD